MVEQIFIFIGLLMVVVVCDVFIKFVFDKFICNLVMFVIVMVVLLLIVLLVKGLIFGMGNGFFEGQLVFWLWLMVLFGNFVEVLVEGCGKVQVVLLCVIKVDFWVKWMLGVGDIWLKVFVGQLLVGEIVFVEIGDFIFVDGEVVEGVVSVNEVVIIGESVFVICEVGGD